MTLLGFANLYCVWPAFLYPIFTNGSEFYFEDGYGKYIQCFCEFAKDGLSPSCIYPVSGIDKHFHIGSRTIYAFQESPASQPLWGDSDIFLPFLFRYCSTLQQTAPDNTPLLTEVTNLIWDILLKNGAIQRSRRPYKRARSARYKRQSSFQMDKKSSSMLLAKTSEYTLHMDFGERTENIFRIYRSFCSSFIRSVQIEYKLPYRYAKLHTQAIVKKVMQASMKNICELFVYVLQVDPPFDTEELVFSINQIIKSEAFNQARIYAEKQRLALPAPAMIGGISNGIDKRGENDDKK